MRALSDGAASRLAELLPQLSEDYLHLARNRDDDATEAERRARTDRNMADSQALTLSLPAELATRARQYLRILREADTLGVNAPLGGYHYHSISTILDRTTECALADIADYLRDRTGGANGWVREYLFALREYDEDREIDFAEEEHDYREAQKKWRKQHGVPHTKDPS